MLNHPAAREYPFNRNSRTWIYLLLFVLSFFAPELRAAEGKADEDKNKPVDPQLAIKQFKITKGFMVDLFAAEPLLKDPVAFCFDEQGRVFVAETARLVTSVYDIRSHMNMYDDDLACRTVADRQAMVHKFLGTNESQLTNQDDSIQLLEDTDGQGKATKSTVFASGFNGILEGLGAGILAHKGNIYYTDIPNLWLLKEGENDKATNRTSLSYGYGVHYNYAGHDLHGLCIGPDGRLYFSIGDRGLHVKTQEGKILDYPDIGTVLRCNLDGSELEVFAYGLRNPQGLAFDDHGNLFTGDNNCDQGDSARLVYVMEGGDSGWRIPYQISETTPAGLWNSEKLWHLQFPAQAAYINPPIAHLANGPSGIAHYPGTGFPSTYRDHLFLSDFRGSPNGSGVHGFAMKEHGAGFDMVDHTEFLWNILATDVKFSPDGRMFVSDWVQGWSAVGQGRLYRMYDPQLVNSELVRDTKNFIADGMDERAPNELEALLAHADQRVRQAAQFEIVDRISAYSAIPELSEKYAAILNRVAAGNSEPLARLHAIWGLGQLGRKSSNVVETLLPLLSDIDPEVRAQTAKVMGEARLANSSDALIRALEDSSARVQSFAAVALGKLGNKDAITPLMNLLAKNADTDPFLRTSGAIGLAGAADVDVLKGAAKNHSRAVRMGALLALRRMKSPGIAAFLNDPDPLVVLEAARAINDVPINGAMPALAALIDQPTPIEHLTWRIINANFRIGKETNALALATYADQKNASDAMRVEALRALENWAKPPPRDRVSGFWRPLPVRDPQVAAHALRNYIDIILLTAPPEVQLAAIKTAQKLGLTDTSPTLLKLASNPKASADLRVEALAALSEFQDPHLSDAVNLAVTDQNENVRKEATRLRANMKPEEATDALRNILQTGTTSEKQNALATLGTLPGQGANQLLSDWLDKLIAGTVPWEIQLDLIEAAHKRISDSIQAKLKAYEDGRPKNDEFAGYREILYGGDAQAGRKVFIEKPEASCVRCHKINGQGGEVGPDLAGIINRHDREYILESIIFPNKQIAPGYESVILEMNNGIAYAGIVKHQTDKEITLLSVEDNKLITVKKSDIKNQIKGQSAMPEGMAAVLGKRDIRNLVEFLATLK